MLYYTLVKIPLSRANEPAWTTTRRRPHRMDCLTQQEECRIPVCRDLALTGAQTQAQTEQLQESFEAKRSCRARTSTSLCLPKCTVHDARGPATTHLSAGLVAFANMASKSTLTRAIVHLTRANTTRPDERRRPTLTRIAATASGPCALRDVPGRWTRAAR